MSVGTIVKVIYCFPGAMLIVYKARKLPNENCYTIVAYDVLISIDKNSKYPIIYIFYNFLSTFNFYGENIF